MISVVLYCQDPKLEQAAVSYLQAHPEFRLTERTDNAQVAVPAILGILPDLVICQDAQNAPALPLLQATHPYTPQTYYLICGVAPEPEHLLALLRCGMRDCIPDPWDITALSQALDRFLGCVKTVDQRSEAEQSMKLRRVLDKKFFEDTIVTSSGSAIFQDFSALEYEYQISFTPGWFQALHILVDPRPRETLYADAFLPVLQVEALARRFFQPECHAMVCYVKDHSLSILLNTVSPPSDLRALCQEFLSRCTREFSWYTGINTISIGIGLETDQPEQLPQLMQSAKMAGWMRLSEGRGRVLEYRRYYSRYYEKHRFLSADTAEALTRSVQSRDVPLCIDTIHRSLDTADNAAAYLSMALSINDVLIAAFREQDNSPVVESRKYLHLAKNMPPMVENLDSLSKIEEAVTNWARDNIEGLLAQEHQREDVAILTARQYLAAHYTEPLRLEAVAGYVGLSSSYFCMKFRQSTGKTFVEYITALRMERAKYLLEHTSRKIHEIGAEVGIQDTRHFSRMFRKTCGMLPTEYRSTHSGKRTAEPLP